MGQVIFLFFILETGLTKFGRYNVRIRLVTVFALVQHMRTATHFLPHQLTTRGAPRHLTDE